jgi:hypothetical protein
MHTVGAWEDVHHRHLIHECVNERTELENLQRHQGEHPMKVNRVCFAAPLFDSGRIHIAAKRNSNQ